MLRDAFAIDAAAVKHRFCNSFRGLCPIDIEFSTFSFGLYRTAPRFAANDQAAPGQQIAAIKASRRGKKPPSSLEAVPSLKDSLAA
jgi:hypothetical protein